MARLGAGGMGEVWKARDTRLDRVVALKFSKAQFSERFQREVKAIAALNHPNIATLFDTGPDYLVMEYVEGSPVRPLPDDPRKLLDQAAQIADGLAAAHAAGFVHRDLKPDNILVTREGRVKILDFGLAKQTTPTANEATVTMTQPGMIVGTMAYMSPEQASGKDVDARSDQFSLGLILYEMATGQRAFQRDTAAELLTAIIRDHPAPLPDKLPAPLRWIIERCLHKDPHERYDSTRDLYHDLRTARERRTESLITPAANVAPPRSRRLWPWAAAAAAAFLLLAGAAWITRPAWRPDPAEYRFTPLATEDHPEFAPSWSPDGRSIAYAVQQNGHHLLVIRSVDSGAPLTVARHAYEARTQGEIRDICWSPDSTRLYYLLHNAIWTVARAGGEPERLLREQGVIRTIALTRDGKTLAVSGGPRSTWLSSPPGAPPVKIVDVWPTEISWSLDGQWLLMTEPTGTGLRLLRMDAKGGQSRVLIENEALGHLDHAWLPDGRHAVLAANPSPRHLRLIDTVTGVQTPLLTTSNPLVGLTLSPDGRRIAYRDGLARSTLLELPLDGSPERKFRSERVVQQELSWSPSGEEYVFVHGEEIRVANRAGTAERTLVSRRDFPAYSGNLHFEKPSYSADGQRVLFTLFGVQQRAQGIWVVAAGGGTPTVIEKAVGFGPVWLGKGSTIAFNPPAFGLARYTLGSQQDPVSFYKGTCDPAPSPDGSWILCPGSIAVSGQPAKMVAVPTAGGEPLVLLDGPAYTGTWSADSQMVYAIRRGENRQELIEVRLHGGAPPRVIRTLPVDLAVRGGYGGPTRMALSPHGKSVITTVRELEGDIWILDGALASRF